MMQRLSHRHRHPIRATRLNPFDDPAFTPAGLVEGILTKYVTMPPHTAIIFALWICFTHVYLQFRIAPRVALNSEGPDSGKSTALEVARQLVFRPNPETLGTGAAIADFLNEGPGTILLDELDQVDAEAAAAATDVESGSHSRGPHLNEGRRPKKADRDLHAPMLAAGDRQLPGADAKKPNIHARDGAVYGRDQAGARVRRHRCRRPQRRVHLPSPLGQPGSTSIPIQQCRRACCAASPTT